ncbi:hypothetical protein ACZ11_05840 [Lysinibacillus xylanilyticus]|uniref:Uncharacterized protein n=2 Tax=Lysinibacillus xylanilyticus TaxID=582475 RepID=A0A0K9FBW8_9BACI|nr:hypothetical protein ACZ11_05840 [Lysinibacillus xylanilyticus]
MGIKMPKANYFNEEITIEEARNNGITTNLFCVCCNAPISYVGPFKRIYGDNKVSIVRDYFKLANTYTHDENCKYNTEGRVKIIARDSDEILKSIDNGKYNFRMNLIATSLKKLRREQVDNESKNTLSDDVNKPKSKEYESNGKLNSYLSTMNKILILRSEIEENKELSTLVQLEFGAESISWNRFYYSTDDHIKCFKYVNGNNIKHPVCIEGKIKVIKEPTEKFKYHSVVLTRPYIDKEDEDGFKRIPAVEVVVYNQSTVDYIKAEVEKGNDQIAFYSFITVKENIYGENIKYLNIKGSIFHKKQVHVYSL